MKICYVNVKVKTDVRIKRKVKVETTKPETAGSITGLKCPS